MRTHFQSLGQFERQDRFGWNRQLFVAGHGRAGDTGAATRQGPDRSAFTPTGDPADDGAQSRASRAHRRSPFALAFGFLNELFSDDRIGNTLDTNRDQMQREL